MGPIAVGEFALYQYLLDGNVRTDTVQVIATTQHSNCCTVQLTITNTEASYMAGDVEVQEIQETFTQKMVDYNSLTKITQYSPKHKKQIIEANQKEAGDHGNKFQLLVDSNYEQGNHAVYNGKNKEGKSITTIARIIKVHQDSTSPYFTIQIPEHGTIIEKQVVSEKLIKMKGIGENRFFIMHPYF